jgi:hypothetical protein
MGSSSLELRIRFDLDTAAANIAADDLKESLREASAALAPRVLREGEQHQDYGTIVGVVLSAPAVIVLARGIADWLRRQAEPVSLVIMDIDGNRVVALGAAAEKLTVDQIAAHLTKALPESNAPRGHRH